MLSVFRAVALLSSFPSHLSLLEQLSSNICAVLVLRMSKESAFNWARRAESKYATLTSDFKSAAPSDGRNSHEAGQTQINNQTKKNFFAPSSHDSSVILCPTVI